MALEQVPEGRKVVRCSGETSVVDPESFELSMHSFPVAPGQFAVGHADIRIGGIDNRAMAALLVAEDDFSNVGEILFQRIRQMESDGLVFAAEGGERLAQVGIEEV